MNSGEIIKYIHKPFLLSEQSIIDVTLLAEKYPYFQTAQLLRIKNLHNLDPGKVKPALNFTASYVTDRKILYYLLHPIQVQTEVNDESAENISEFKTTFPEKEVKDTIQENISDTLENQISYRDTHNNDEIDFSTSIDIKKEYGEGIELDEYVVLINKTDADFVEFIPDEKVKSKGVENETSTEPKKTTNKPDTQKIEEDDILTLINKGVSHDKLESTGSDLSEKQKKKNALIDNFIKSNPKIKPARETDEKTEDISLNSVLEDDHLITDTLANIYLKQGNYAKAIFAYEKLSLKYPEKSAYFAGQIAEIKKRIEQTK